MSPIARQELIASFREEYVQADRNRKIQILDLIVSSTGYDRKHVIKTLKNPPSAPRSRTRRCTYDESVRLALSRVWQAAGCICAKRLIPFIPEFVPVLERHNHLKLPDNVRNKLLKMSASTADRLLQSERKKLGRSRSSTVPSNILRQQIAIRTFADWEDNGTPGKCEADLVCHNGGDVHGRFAYTLTVTDVFIGWTECMAIDGKHRDGVIQALSRIQNNLPFKIACLDTDNGGEFLNEELVRYCDQMKITFTRGRPYKKNDQAHVEQKNGAVVRRFVGYERFEGKKAVSALNKLYSVCRMYVNFFQPSLKLDTKERTAGKVRKRYLPAKTPYQRLLQTNISMTQREALLEQFQQLDPVLLLEEIKRLQLEVSSLELRSEPIQSELPSITMPDAKGFVVHRTKKHKGRGRKSLLSASLRDQVHAWLTADPSLNGPNIIERLNSLYPGSFTKSHRNTLDRVVRAWRLEHPCYENLYGGRYTNNWRKLQKILVSL